MKYKVYYVKNLKMSPEKLASQVAHITLNLGSGLGGRVSKPSEQTIVVLGLNRSKFFSVLEQVKSNMSVCEYHVQKDLGLTEIESGTITAFGYIE